MAPGQQLRHLVTGVVRLVAVAVGLGESGAQAGQVPPFLFQFALQGMLGVVHKTSGNIISRQDTPARAPEHGEAVTAGVRSCEKKSPASCGAPDMRRRAAGFSGGSC